MTKMKAICSCFRSWSRFLLFLFKNI